MAHRLSSPLLIKGINGILNRSPNEIDYSTLNAKSMETRNQPGKEKSRKSKKYKRSRNMAKDMKKDKIGGKIDNLMEPGNPNEIKLMKTDRESDGKENRETAQPQPKKCENPTSNIDTTNDNNNCTNASKNIDNGKVTNIKSVNGEKTKEKDQKPKQKWKRKRKQKRTQIVKTRPVEMALAAAIARVIVWTPQLCETP